MRRRLGLVVLIGGALLVLAGCRNDDFIQIEPEEIAFCPVHTEQLRSVPVTRDPEVPRRPISNEVAEARAGLFPEYTDPSWLLPGQSLDDPAPTIVRQCDQCHDVYMRWNTTYQQRLDPAQRQCELHDVPLVMEEVDILYGIHLYPDYYYETIEALSPNYVGVVLGPEEFELDSDPLTAWVWQCAKCREDQLDWIERNDPRLRRDIAEARAKLGGN